MEIWKDINGYEGLYEISTNGEVKNKKTNRILKFWINEKGYKMIDLYKNKIKKHEIVHRLVAKTFIPNNENKPFVNHIDGDKQNDNVLNLEWVTPSENNIHAYQTGLAKPSKKTKVYQYSLDGNFIREWEYIKDVEKTLKICHTNIIKCCKGQRNMAGGYIWKYKKERRIYTQL